MARRGAAWRARPHLADGCSPSPEHDQVGQWQQRRPIAFHEIPSSRVGSSGRVTTSLTQLAGHLALHFNFSFSFTYIHVRIYTYIHIYIYIYIYIYVYFFIHSFFLPPFLLSTSTTSPSFPTWPVFRHTKNRFSLITQAAAGSGGQRRATASTGEDRGRSGAGAGQERRQTQAAGVQSGVGVPLAAFPRSIHQEPLGFPLSIIQLYQRLD